MKKNPLISLITYYVTDTVNEVYSNKNEDLLVQILESSTIPCHVYINVFNVHIYLISKSF